jgi:hypothetical protein
MILDDVEDGHAEGQRPLRKNTLGVYRVPAFPPGGQALAVNAEWRAGSGLLFAQQVEHDVVNDVVSRGRPDHGPDPPGQGHRADRLVEFHAGFG